MARKPEDKRVTATIDQDTYDKLSYIADKKGISVSEALREGIDLLIRYVNEDYYPLAKLEAERINQLTENIVTLNANIKNLENVTIEGFSSLLSMTRGDNYLFEDEEDV